LFVLDLFVSPEHCRRILSIVVRGIIGLRKMALRKLRSKPSFCEAEREPALPEPVVSICSNTSPERVRWRQAYAVIFSHFSEALIFFVTFFYQVAVAQHILSDVSHFIIWPQYYYP